MSLTLKCKDRTCRERHPKGCKWFQREVGCRRINCAFLHTNLATNAVKESEYFECVSCKSVWKDKKCVVEHVIQHRKVYFCLNCDDWLAKKSEVFNVGWTLLDQHGNLRQDV